jgi:hypothetical protein
MSYGKDFYPRALRILTGAQSDPEPATSDSEPANEKKSAELNSHRDSEQDAIKAQAKTTRPSVADPKDA